MNDYIIIDIREYDEYKVKHLEKSINVPFFKLIIEPGKYLSKNNKYMLVCEYGIKSKKTSAILNKMGYNTISLSGGMKDFK